MKVCDVIYAKVFYVYKQILSKHWLEKCLQVKGNLLFQLIWKICLIIPVNVFYQQ